jgi:DNA invertase Pin-like site-specific DNA recombinase
MKIGYIRVSTEDQNLGRQEEAMKALGVERIFSDKASGKTMAREQYQALRSQLRPGDVIYFDALDRLGRNYAEILAEWKWLTDVAKCEIVCLNPSFMSTIEFAKMGDLGKPMEAIALNFLGYIAQHEREEMLRRQKAGIAIAKAKGKYLGKPRKHCDPRRLKEYIKLVDEQSFPINDASKLLGISRSTFNRRRREIHDEAKMAKKY